MKKGISSNSRYLSLVLFLIILQGCATPATSTSNYTPPSVKEINNEIVVNKDFETVWDGLVKGLAKSFFVVNNIEKASRLINVSFSTETPEDYVDCGRTSRAYTKGSKIANYEYDTASNSKFTIGEGTSQNGNFTISVNIIRKTSLEGKINIYVAPENKDSVVSVNSKYVLSVNTIGTRFAENLGGYVVQTRDITPEKFTMAFSTNEKGTSSDETWNCVSRGNLEEKILEIVKGI